MKELCGLLRSVDQHLKFTFEIRYQLWSVFEFCNFFGFLHFEIFLGFLLVIVTDRARPFAVGQHFTFEEDE